jgi:hypothetical protein
MRPKPVRYQGIIRQCLRLRHANAVQIGFPSRSDVPNARTWSLTSFLMVKPA